MTYGNNMSTTGLRDPSEDIVDVPLTQTEIILFNVILILGVLFNIYTAIALIQTNVNSLLSKLLLYNQNIMDGAFGVMAIVTIDSRNFEEHGTGQSMNPFVCYILKNWFLLRVVRLLLVCNVVCQSADRFWAIVYPKTYRAYTKVYIITCYVSIPVYAVLGSITRVFAVTMVNGECVSNQILLSEEVMTAVESIFRYGIPMIFLIVLNILVIRRLYQLRIIRLKSTPTSTPSQDNLTDDTERGENSTRAIIAVQMAIFLSAIVLMVEMTLLELLNITLSALSLHEWVDFGPDSHLRMYYYILLGFFAGINPCLQILTMTTLRITMIKQWRKLTSKCCTKRSNTSLN
ncbi:unnamed protein product [Echinostoma caproni]|uniref:G_PROTEIN_RECEP_F1_2 domain-containing protein n=1 Tax=Echinostoma caproni TaxID=27848 RepID=A0A183AZ70_9TREM|nr:unnamed protein product [Echinostoma caproni]